MTFKEYKDMTSHDIAERLYHGENGNLNWWAYVSALRSVDSPMDTIEKRGIDVKALLTCFIRGKVVRSTTKNWALGVAYFMQEIYNLMDTHKLTRRIPITELPRHYISHAIQGLTAVSSFGGEVADIAGILKDICVVRCVEMTQIKRIYDIIQGPLENNSSKKGGTR